MVVLYHPNADPGALIEQLLGQLTRTLSLLILADNTSNTHPALQALRAQPGLVLLATRNRGGLAGAYNQAIAHLTAQHPEITHLVLLDEDSDAAGLGAFLTDTDVMALLADEHTAAVAPAYVDRATGLRGKHIELGRFQLRYLPRQFEGLRRVAFVIGSRSVWRMAALQRLGNFSEALAVDHVDTEYCLRARAAALAIYVHGSHEFLHAIGARRRYRFMGRDLQAGGHSAARRYLIGRNTACLGRSMLWREPAFALLCLARLLYEALGIIKVEERRLPKLAALLRGAWVGLLNWRLP